MNFRKKNCNCGEPHKDRDVVTFCYRTVYRELTLEKTFSRTVLFIPPGHTGEFGRINGVAVSTGQGQIS